MSLTISLSTEFPNVEKPLSFVYWSNIQYIFVGSSAILTLSPAAKPRLRRRSSAEQQNQIVVAKVNRTAGKTAGRRNTGFTDAGNLAFIWI